MVAGTIAVGGTTGRWPGLAMRRGTLFLLQNPPELLPTFNDCGIHPFTVLTLLVRAWRRFPGRFAALPEAGLRVRRYMGDLGNDGRGEILIPA
jgi:formylmethanofuran dehydrogenase subunit C